MLFNTTKPQLTRSFSSRRSSVLTFSPGIVARDILFIMFCRMTNKNLAETAQLSGTYDFKQEFIKMIFP